MVPGAAVSILILATQSAPLRQWSNKDSINLVVILGILIVGIVIGGMVLMYFRRKMNERESAFGNPGSIMEELRRLRKEGVLSEAEYEASRRAATSKLMPSKGATAPAAPEPKSRPVPRPSAVPPRRASEGGKPTERVAKPGFDLTGAPLPKPTDDGARPG